MKNYYPILVVDDSLDYRFILSKILGRFDFHEAVTPLQALDVLRGSNQKFFVITNKGLGFNADGIDLIEKICDEQISTSGILLISADYRDAEFELESLAEKVHRSYAAPVEFLSKPFAEEALLSKMGAMTDVIIFRTSDITKIIRLYQTHEPKSEITLRSSRETLFLSSEEMAKITQEKNYSQFEQGAQTIPADYWSRLCEIFLIPPQSVREGYRPIDHLKAIDGAVKRNELKFELNSDLKQLLKQFSQYEDAKRALIRTRLSKIKCGPIQSMAHA